MSTGVERANEVVLGKITSCQGCGASALEPVLDLGHHAPCDSLLTEQMLGEPETHFPLVFCRCTSCGLAQLDYAAPPEVVFFPEYPYRTAMTGLLKEHFWSLTHDVTERLGLGEEDLAIDIGSNDGTLLQGFQQEGVRVLGIEPTDIAKIAVDNDVPTVQAFFSEEVAEQVRAEHGNAAVVTGTNMFAHVNNLFPELRGVATLIGDDGAFVSESHYLLNLIEELQYDTIYHEHLRFYSLKPMIEIFNRAGFSIFDVERVPTHGGSIRVWADRGKRDVSPRVDELVRLEEESGLYDGVAFDRFRQRIQDGKLRLLELLVEARKEGPIVGLGAPGRASTLLAYTGVTPELVDSICELTGSLKIGQYTPGTHIPIVDERTLYERQPPHVLVLSWHIGEAIMPKIRERGYRGKFIVPLPDASHRRLAQPLRVFFIGAHLPLAGHSVRAPTVVIREALAGVPRARPRGGLPTAALARRRGGLRGGRRARARVGARERRRAAACALRAAGRGRLHPAPAPPPGVLVRSRGLLPVVRASEGDGGARAGIRMRTSASTSGRAPRSAPAPRSRRPCSRTPATPTTTRWPRGSSIPSSSRSRSERSATG